MPIWILFRQLDAKVTVDPIKCDGDSCFVDDLLLVVDGKAGALLTAERTALNFLQRLSGIATEARRFVEVVSGDRKSTRLNSSHW